jgi:hypothetical protein
VPHWKQTATRCAVPACERTRVKGWSTCALIGHYARGVSLYGLAPKAPKLIDAGDKQDACPNPDQPA